jgi:lipopolysaccharide export system permease protein
LYVLRQHLVPWLLGFGVVTGILQIDLLVDYLDLWLKRGVPLWAVGELFLFAMGWMAALSVPCGVLVASLMTFGRMSQDLEIVAIKSSGINLFQVILWPLVGAGLLSVGLALFNTFVLPETNHSYANLLADIGRMRPTVRLREGVFNNNFPGYRLLVEKINPKTNELSGVSLLDFGASRTPTLIVAQRGLLSYSEDGKTGILTLWDGEIHEEPANVSTPGTYRVLRFDEHVVRVAGAGDVLERHVRQHRSEREMSTGQLLTEIGTTKTTLGTARARLADRLARAGLPPETAPWVEGRAGVYGWIAAVGGLFSEVEPPDWNALSPGDQSELTLSRIEIETVRKRVALLEVEYHKKYSLALACVVFVLVGAPLGIRVRRGGITVGFLSMIFFLFYFICIVAGEGLAERLFISPALAMWLPDVLLLGLGIPWTLHACDIRLRRRPKVAA